MDGSGSTISADPLDNYTLRAFAPCGVIAGLYARIDSTSGVWKAPAGTEATLSDVRTPVYRLTDGLARVASVRGELL